MPPVTALAYVRAPYWPSYRAKIFALPVVMARSAPTTALTGIPVSMTKHLLRFCLMALFLGATHAQAQSTSGSGGLFIGGNSGPVQAGSSKTCVQVSIAGEKPSPYSCLNQELQQQAQGITA